MRRLVVLFCLFLLCIQEIYAQQQVSDELRAYNDYLLSLSCYKASGELNMAIGEKFMEGDIFRIIVPLNERKTKETITQSATQSTQSDEIKPVQRIIEIIEQNPLLSQKQMAEKLSLNQNTLKYYIKKMREKGIIERVGSSRKGKWVVK